MTRSASTPGFAIFAAPPRPAEAALAPLHDLAVPLLSDCMGRLYGAVGLRPYHRGGRMVGPAFTVKTRPGDNLMIHQALDLAQPGDVIVVDGGGEVANALLGEIMLRWAVARKLGGFVIDGAIRDVEAYARSDFPCFARGQSHRGPYKDGPGEINVPVCIGGMAVCPGDVMIGDADGVLAFPVDRLAELTAKAAAKLQQEEADFARIAGGAYPRPWLSEAMRRNGVDGP